ncbi:sigma 54-interacting transcriptional regulator [Oceanobacillus luteolus]|uniref:Sigma-54 interaction domain-containing protein n=1 Tax=Oceanobacillus luteolus TaxID=1274358 RepID=A0ABW4HPF2_9BACI|nr:sigma 54-interacting transcriptional regulator [Oceanobacillus luteolus]MCM3740424.1 sigma 54-interacting transcriptional regulator [Oceanobacillus luteolus]
MITISENVKDAIFEVVFEHSYHCIVVVDRDGIITHLNNSYCQFLEVKKEDAIGKHVTDVIENSRMHIVAETGKEEIAQLQYIRGNHMVANRIPVRANGKVIGAVGTVLFRDTKEWVEMNSHIKNLLLEIEQYRKQLKEQHGLTYSLHDIVGSSEKINSIKNTIKKVSPGDVSVLIRGESGTGKELFAHSIHHLSERHNKPFVKVNCGAIPENLIESELFGYKEGAFTDAKKGGKPGKFQLADGGTIFLDEIGDMPLNAQVKLLRVLQEGEVEPIGALRPEKVDVRVITATNQPLEQLIKENRFREDLFYRINVIQVVIPPLRERVEDIRVLANYILNKVTKRTGKRVSEIDPQVMELFMQYRWPGNVRELENTIESAVHLANSTTITIDDLPNHLQQESFYDIENHTLKEIIQRTEKQVIERVLHKVDGDKTKAATLLGIGKSSLYEKLKKYDL